MIRILVIEDNAANLELMRYLLTYQGHAVKTASDGLQGMKMVYETTPDVVICDIQIPGIDGIEVVSRIKQDATLCNISVIAVTAFAMDSDKSRIMNAGFDGYITKPITPETFVTEITGFMKAPVNTGARHD